MGVEMHQSHRTAAGDLAARPGDRLEDAAGDRMIAADRDGIAEVELRAIDRLPRVDPEGLVFSGGQGSRRHPLDGLPWRPDSTSRRFARLKETAGVRSDIDLHGLRHTMITELLAMKLQEKGHNVEKAAGGWDALNRLTNHSYDLLITDLSLPGASGVELAGALRDRSPALPVIFATGRAEDPDLPSDGRSVTLIKPYDAAKLVEAIASLTGRAAG